MELYDKQELQESVRVGGGSSSLRPDMAFLAENPEAFGLVSDAFPVATGNLLIAANGYVSPGGGQAPLLETPSNSAEDLLNTLFGGLLEDNEENVSLLNSTFGSHVSHREQPVSRYSALLAEALALRILQGPAVGASFEQTCVMLGSELRHGLHVLREAVREIDSEAADDDAFFTVSLGACRVTELGDGDYGLDVFSWGDYRVYLLDESGMAPLWTADSPVISAGGEEDPHGRSLRFHHPEPFAVLLLSDSVCAQNAAEHRTQRSTPGLVWRHRMRLEDHFLRLLTSCVREKEFGDRAAHLFTGRFHGRDSGGGAMTVVRGDSSYEVFRAVCQKRLAVLEKLISLIPEGYDPENPPAPPTRLEAENQYLRRLLERNAGLEERVSAALRQCVLQKLRDESKNCEATPCPDAPDYRRLDPREILEIYRRYDVDNDEDRARIEENRRILREALADHWITLRPCFLTVTKDCAHPARREENRRSYESCLELNRELSALLRRRKETLASLQTLLTDSLTVLENDQSDWICGRSGDHGVQAFVAPLARELPTALDRLGEDWERETERHRSLHAAYTAERENLFRRDVAKPYGFFAADWQAIREGSLPDERWQELKGSLTREDRTATAYGELWDTLCRISKATGLLTARINARAADSRTARELSDRNDLRWACLRASAYEDADWGEEAVAVMSPAMRNEYRLMLRRHREAMELHNHRVAMYEEYSRMYRAYGEEITP